MKDNQITPNHNSFTQREIERLSSRRGKLFSLKANQSVNDQEHLGHTFESENIYQGIRRDALAFFQIRNIAWHGCEACDRSILSSQVAALNFFFPFCKRPSELAAVFAGFLPDVVEALPITADKQDCEAASPFATFEWIGLKNYLKEPGGRVRGKYVTNVDALFRFRTKSGRIQLLLVEWKYKESYQEAKSTRYSSRGTDRLKIYAPFLSRSDCSICSTFSAESLFVDPFDQLMRLQLLAGAMELEREMGADDVAVVLIAPRANKELNETITCKPLAGQSSTIQLAWNSIVTPGKFHAIHTEDLLQAINSTTADRAWADYLTLRYGDMN